MKQVSWRCTCHDAHFLTLTWWPEDADQVDFGSYLDLEGNYWATFPQRLRIVWKVLWRRHIDTTVDLLLSREGAREVAAELMKFAEYDGKSHSDV